jgi:hypothetical protein
VPAHTDGCEGNLLVETQIRSLRIPGPLNGVLDVPAAGHPLCRFLPRSGSSGVSDPTSWFCLLTLIFGKCLGNSGAHF